MRAVASEPRRSFAIRALPLPDSMVLAGQLGGCFRLFRGRPVLRHPFELSYRLPAAAVRTPQLRKLTIAPLSTFSSEVLGSICGSILARRPHSRIVLYFNDLNKLFDETRPRGLRKVGLFTLGRVFSLGGPAKHRLVNQHRCTNTEDRPA